jgi:hypothetical protein
VRASPFQPSQSKDCVIVRANEFYTIVRTPNGPGILFCYGGRWSRYEVLFASGLLTEGQHLELLSKGELDESGRWKMYLPLFPYRDRPSVDELFDGEVVLIRRQSMRDRETKLRNIIYVHIRDGYIIRTECNDVLDITEHYSVGQIVKIRLPEPKSLRGSQKRDSRASVLKGIPFGLLESLQSIDDRPRRNFQIGERVMGLVVGLSSGAFILVEDHCLVFLPSDLVMPGKVPVQTVLQCGDKVEGSIIEIPKDEDQPNSNYRRFRSGVLWERQLFRSVNVVRL